MSSTQASSPLSQILSDIEDIIELRMALCRRWATSDHHPFISVDWMDFQLQEKIDEAGRRVSTAPPRRAKCMTRMLNIQNELCIEQFRDLPHEMGLVIERLKVVIEGTPEVSYNIIKKEHNSGALLKKIKNLLSRVHQDTIVGQTR